MGEYRATAHLEDDGWRVSVDGVGTFWAQDLVSARALAHYAIGRTHGDREPTIEIEPVIDTQSPE